MRKFFGNNKSWIILSIVGGVIAIVAATPGSVKIPEDIARLQDSLPAIIDYNIHVKPILSDKCFVCHGPDKGQGQKAGLDLSTAETATAKLESGHRAIVPHRLSRSELYHRITTTEESLVMPAKESNRTLTSYEKAILVKWIEQGAEYKPHWAFTPPVKKPLPEVKNKEWPVNPIDYFVLNKLEENGLKPSPQADKETLLRRVSLDLTGLPPSVEEMNAFLADTAPDAYEKVVNRLLQSKQYGEKMAVDWLDVARYADTHGYTVDRYRDTWPWKDWVIKAFNENMPFNTFTTWQLAGDLLPNPTREQMIATTFNRNHAQNMEGGIINEEFRNEYVVDRTSTVGTAFLGMTVGCARCHDHKFDPISIKDFYSLYSFFNNVDEAGQISFNDATPGPSIMLTTKAQDAVLAYLAQKENQTIAEKQRIEAQEKSNYQTWKQTIGNTVPFDLQQGLQAHFSFDKLENGAFTDQVNPANKGVVADAVLVPGKSGEAFKSNGDDILKLGKAGIFGRYDPFSISLWIYIPKGVDKAVIFHKGDGDITYGFRGYYLNLKDGKAEFLMAHVWPGNEFLKRSEQPLPKEKWINIALTYNGSGKAAGANLYLDGRLLSLVTVKDHLYKDILFGRTNEPGLQVGADWRGTGFKGGLVDELFVYTRELNPFEVQMRAQNKQAAQYSAAAVPDVYLQQYYFSNISAAWQQTQQALQALRQERNKTTAAVPELMVMEEMKQKRQTHILERGVYDNPGKAVSADVPNAILPYPDGLRKDRLGLARWLLDPKNPLTARVIVNRYWQTYFGKGIQKTADNFGNQGSIPTHLDLLDWLAVTFRESGWDVKAMQKLIVMSATYRQSSYATAGQLEKDKDNNLLGRGPASRLTAEMMRDGVLRASGLLSDSIGGPPVKPYQPEGVWAINSVEYVRDSGINLYRRSLYTFWRRTNPPPSMNTFDAPLRSSCVVQRQQTNTPLQALVLLNDPQYIEAARVLFYTALQKYNTLAEQVLYCYRALTGRSPSAKEINILENLYNSEFEKFKTHPDKAKGWLTMGEYRIKEKTDPRQIAAGAVMATTIMNSDAYITKR
ncbi:DUF1553 domain-containing protein [Niabella drilacis]|uniref:Planctomycete cytochrome C n=1 Tax=Niabella drilacis (strain DSM 25811 / CCM 8410 / CCUG 62505 / LMG 26954 / E90) TaxID=1285928 RepID=A0A1G6JF31_NIADE|nr:DUF1553 domain-containing protein [Niabella drilacis]SDC17348.1 Planctomycete cytochrome C [Niabella drilacis]